MGKVYVGALREQFPVQEHHVLVKQDTGRIAAGAPPVFLYKNE